jgi:hypothetical protein
MEMSVFNKSKLTNLRKRIEKEYDVEQCPFAKKILETIAECYDECSNEREKELRKEKNEYSKEYNNRDVECECGETMLHNNIYTHQQTSCPLRHRPKKPSYDKCELSRCDVKIMTDNMEWIEEYLEDKKQGGKKFKDFTEEEFNNWWVELKKTSIKCNRSISGFKKRIKRDYNFDLI